MREQILFTYDNMHSGELFYQSPKWDESEINVLTIDEPIGIDKGLEQLYQEAEEYDFLIGKTPKDQKDNLDND